MFEDEAIDPANIPVLLSSIGRAAGVVDDASSFGLFTLFQYSINVMVFD